MARAIDTVLNSGNLALHLAEQMLKGIEAERFARQPAGASGRIDTNHPAFVFGHLSLYPAMALEVAGLPTDGATAPESFAPLFKAGVECRDDAEGTIYPRMEEITSTFFTTHRAAMERLASLDDAAMVSPNPREGRMRELFPTVGGMLVFALCSHPMMHLGQVSAWRRCMGMGPAM